MNSNYCPLIFHGIYVERSFKSIFLSPCCIAKKVNLSQGGIDFTNNSFLNKLRAENLNNIRSPECNSCWNLEDAGGESKRRVTLDQYINNEIPTNTKATLYSIDYNTLPICNAKCVICSPKYSSTWAAASGVSLKNITTDNYDHLNGLDISNLKTLYFNGGEPLLTDEHLIFLRKIKNLSVVDIMYNTNGSCYPNEEVINLWTKAKNVKLFFSIDAVGEQFEKIRTPLKWNIVSSNIKKIYTNNIVETHCSFTLGRHNVYNLEETINWFTQLTNFDSYSRFHVHCVNEEHYLNMNRASKEERENFKNELIKFKDYYWFTSIMNSIK